jgi:hypothetical protein
MTMTNGGAATMVIRCRPAEASEGWSPPASNITAATVPVRQPRKMTPPRRGCSAPLELTALACL